MATIRTAIQIQDGMSQAFQSMNNAMNIVISSFETLQNASGNAVDTASIQAARRELNQAEATFNQIEEEIKKANGAQRGFNNEIRAGTSDAGELLSRITQITTGILAAVGAYKVFSSAKSFFSDIFSRGIEFHAFKQASEVAFTTFLGDAEKAKQYMDDMYAFALKTPFAYPDLLASSRNLIAFGVAAENTFPIMQAIGDAVAAVGGSNADIANAADIFGVIQAQGKITAMEVNRLSNYGINAYEMLGKAAGVSAIEMQKRISKGAVGASEAITGLVEGMNEKFGGLMEGVKGTWKGAIDSMNSATRNAGVKMMEDFMVAEGPLVTLVQNITSQIKKIPDYIGPAVAAFLPLIDTLNEALDENRFDNLFAGFAASIIFIANLLSWMGETAIWTATAISDNWSILSPLIGSVTAALTGYATALIAVKLAKMATAIWTAITTTATLIYAAAMGMGAGSTWSMVAAAWGLNAALAANPIFLVIMAIAILIGIVYAAVAAINFFAGTSYSATGMIAGAFAVMGAFIANLFLALLQIVFAVVERLYNSWIAFANFFGNVFNDPIGSIIHLFGDLGDNVLGVIEKIARALDFVFGKNLGDTVAGWRTSLAAMTNWAAKEYGNGEYEVLFEKLDMDSVLSDLGVNFDRFEYGNAWDSGYDWGSNLFNKDPNKNAGPKQDNYEDLMSGIQGALNPLTDNGKKTAGNTAKMAKTMEASEEDLKYLRDLADRDFINRFTTAEIKVDFKSENTINSDLDLDGIIDQFAEKLEEAIDVAAEGA